MVLLSVLCISRRLIAAFPVMCAPFQVFSSSCLGPQSDAVKVHRVNDSGHNLPEINDAQFRKELFLSTHTASMDGRSDEHLDDTPDSENAFMETDDADPASHASDDEGSVDYVWQMDEPMDIREYMERMVSLRSITTS